VISVDKSIVEADFLPLGVLRFVGVSSISFAVSEVVRVRFLGEGVNGASLEEEER
jgi:hypothetical protein